MKIRNDADMAKLLLKFQRYFRRKPIRFFTLIALYLTAGSLVFLHAGFSGETRVPGAAPRPSNGAAEGTEAQLLGALPLGRELRAMPESLVLARRYGTWFKNPPKDAAGRSRGDYGETWTRVLKGRSTHEKEEDRGNVPLGKNLVQDKLGIACRERKLKSYFSPGCLHLIKTLSTVVLGQTDI